MKDLSVIATANTTKKVQPWIPHRFRKAPIAFHTHVGLFFGTAHWVPVRVKVSTFRLGTAKARRMLTPLEKVDERHVPIAREGIPHHEYVFTSQALSGLLPRIAM
jgi:hypothetical protein